MEEWLAYVFLLFVHMADLEPDVLLGKGRWWRVDYVLEALQGKSAHHTSPLACRVREELGTHLQTLAVLLLLLVNYAKPEVDFVCLVKARFHLHDL